MKMKRLKHRSKKWKVFNRRRERYRRHKLLSSFADYYEDKNMPEFTIIEGESFSEAEKRRRKAKSKYQQALILRALIQDEQNDREQILKEEDLKPK